MLVSHKNRSPLGNSECRQNAELEGATAKLQQMEQMTRTAIAHAIARIDGRLAATPRTVDDDPR